MGPEMYVIYMQNSNLSHRLNCLTYTNKVKEIQIMKEL